MVAKISQYINNTTSRTGATLIFFLFGIMWGQAVNFTWIIGIPVTALFLAVLYAHRKHLRAYSMAWGLYAGYMAVSISWFWGMFPMDHAGVPNPFLASFLIILAWGSVFAAIACSALPYMYILKKIPSLPVYLHACLWVLIEILGSFCFYILTVAEQALFGAHYTFGFVGYTLASTPLNQLFAPIGGVFLLSFVYFYIALTLVSFWSGQFRLRWNMLWILVLLSGSLAYGSTLSQAPVTNTQTIAAVRGHTEPTFGFDTDDQLTNVLLYTFIIDKLNTSSTGIDVIILPEDSRYLQWHREHLISPPSEIGIIDSARERFDSVQAHVNTYHSDQGYNYGYTKRLLVSEGEYLSWYYQTLVTLTGNYSLVRQFTSQREYQKGEYYDSSDLLDITYGVTMCSELHSPWIQSHMSRVSPVLINLASHSILHGHPLLEKQTTEMAQVRAAESHRYLVRSNNYAPAIIVDSSGEIIGDSGINVHTTGLIKFYDITTLFTRIPLLVPLICLLLLFWFALAKKRFAQK